MKKTLLSAAVLALFVCAPPAAKSADVSVDFFYDNLSGGNWIEVADYGYCWQPDVVVTNQDWRPYADGYWAYTDLGWTWVSYEDFGWATYHYGRWARLEGYGWVWVPGRDADLEWGPAWVSWRYGDNYVGWAPLPPDTIALVERRPITGHLDVEFNIGPGCYNFVDVRYFGEPVLRERIMPVTQNVTYIQKTVNVTNITYKNRTVYNNGPDIAVINKRSSRPIQRLHLEREGNVNFSTAAKSGALTKVQGDKLLVAAPMRVTKATRQAAPHTVKAKVEKAKVERGWSVVGDQKAQEQFKQKIKAQNLKEIPAPTENGAAGQAGPNMNASPSRATGSEKSIQAGTGNGKNRRSGPGQAGAGSPEAGASAAEQARSAPPEANTARTPKGEQMGAQGGERKREREQNTQQPQASGTPPAPERRGRVERQGAPEQTFSQPGSQGNRRGEPSRGQGQGGHGGKGKGESSPSPGPR